MLLDVTFPVHFVVIFLLLQHGYWFCLLVKFIGICSTSLWETMVVFSQVLSELNDQYNSLETSLKVEPIPQARLSDCQKSIHVMVNAIIWYKRKLCYNFSIYSKVGITYCMNPWDPYFWFVLGNFFVRKAFFHGCKCCILKITVYDTRLCIWYHHLNHFLIISIILL